MPGEKPENDSPAPNFSFVDLKPETLSESKNQYSRTFRFHESF